MRVHYYWPWWPSGLREQDSKIQLESSCLDPGLNPDRGPACNKDSDLKVDIYHNGTLDVII